MSEIQTYNNQQFETLGLNTRDNQSFGLTDSGNVARRVIDPDNKLILQDILNALDVLNSLWTKTEITIPALSTVVVDVNLLNSFSRIDYICNFKNSLITVTKSLKIVVQNASGSLSDSISERLGGSINVSLSNTDDNIDQFFEVTNNEAFSLKMTFLKAKI